MSKDSNGGVEREVSHTPKCPVCDREMAGTKQPLHKSRAGSFGIHDVQYVCPTHGPRLPK